MKKSIILVSLLLAALFVFAGCGEQESNIIEPQQDVLPLELIEAISNEWKSTGHQYAVTVTANRGINCAKCHDGVGHAEQLQYAEVDFLPEHQTGIDCQACHTGFGKEGIDTGLAKLPFLSEPFEGGTGAMCASCHNGNNDPGALFAQSEAGELRRFSYPHYGANAAILTGKGGMEIPGVEYISSKAHSAIEDSCVACHMPVTKDGYKSHTFKADFEYKEETCDSCHVEEIEKTVNMRELQDEIKKDLEKLRLAILEATGAARIDSGGGAFTYYDANDNPITTIPHEAYVATYNWRLVDSEGSYGVHNPLYAKSLIGESYKYLMGEGL